MQTLHRKNIPELNGENLEVKKKQVHSIFQSQLQSWEVKIKYSSALISVSLKHHQTGDKQCEQNEFLMSPTLIT